RWSVPATFVDIDRDGWLDLFVGNYVEYTIASHKLCRTLAGAPDYCGPLSYKPEPDRLFRNLGRGKDGRVSFEDLSARSGITAEYGGGLGAVPADFNADGWLDLYVANDGMPNQMWINGKDNRFRNEALLAGTSVNLMGQPEASMGVTVGDFDADGDEDIFVTHLIRETNTLYLNDGTGLFEDATEEAGLGAPSWAFTGFGTVWFDYDNDGWLDLLAANGEVKVIPELEAKGDPHPLHQTNQLYRNLGGAGTGVRFAEVTSQAGKVFELSEVSRGVAAGDVDNDGDADILLLNNNGPVRLLINQVGHAKPWIGLRLVAGEPDIDQLGAWVGVYRAGGSPIWRRVTTGGSFLSASDPRVLVGLGDSPRVERVVVRWPGGEQEQWQPEANRYTTLRRGSGRPVEAP
ncbi:MAG: CRTAC1 family protein, partial [Acidobacteriota bacterium]